jgi:hypothetical protein
MKPRIFLGSSGKQAKLVQALTRGLAEVAEVEPWTTVFNPGSRRSTPGRADPRGRFRRVRLRPGRLDQQRAGRDRPGQASPRDNVVFEAGLFGGALGMRRTFILHAKGAKLPTDLLGMTAVRYPEGLTPADMREVNQKLRKAIEDEGRWPPRGRLVAALADDRTEREPSVISLLRISRDREAASRVRVGRGRRTARYRRGTGARRRRSAATRRASSTSGRASALGSRTHPRSRARARFASSPTTGRRAGGRRAPTPTPRFMSGHRGSTCALIRRTCASSMRALRRRAQNSSPAASKSGRRT